MNSRGGFFRRKLRLLALAEIRRDIEREISWGVFDRGLSGNLDSVLNLQERYGAVNKTLRREPAASSGTLSLESRGKH